MSERVKILQPRLYWSEEDEPVAPESDPGDEDDARTRTEAAKARMLALYSKPRASTGGTFVEGPEGGEALDRALGRAPGTFE